MEDPGHESVQAEVPDASECEELKNRYLDRLHSGSELPGENALCEAMKILADVLPAVFKDLCPRCFNTFSLRLSGIASGLELAEIVKRRCSEPCLPAAYCYDGATHADTCSVDTEHEGGNDTASKASEETHRTLTIKERERIRYLQVRRKKDFVYVETIRGKKINLLEGLELHTNMFSAAEQTRLLALVFELEEKGWREELKERTFSGPRRGKGRVRIQFGCCYNYAKEKDGNPPGILRDEEADPLPPLLKSTIKRLVRWRVLPPDCVPDSCIINIYEEGDFIPPHVDHHDFLRPFCTVSLLSECNMVLGYQFNVSETGEFEGSVAIPLPVGSVFVLNGNGADVAKHCIPAVPQKRVSLTFRKMDPRRWPYRYQSDPEMQSIAPIRT